MRTGNWRCRTVALRRREGTFVWENARKISSKITTLQQVQTPHVGAVSVFVAELVRIMGWEGLLQPDVIGNVRTVCEGDQHLILLILADGLSRYLMMMMMTCSGRDGALFTF